MNFKENKPIYLQIVGYVSDKVRNGEWQEQERIPSVRELGTILGVNPNTCMRAYEYLTREDIIVNSRGIGYSVTEGAKLRLFKISKREFFEEILPEIFSLMKNLDISIDEIIDQHGKHIE